MKTSILTILTLSTVLSTALGCTDRTPFNDLDLHSTYQAGIQDGIKRLRSKQQEQAASKVNQDIIDERSRALVAFEGLIHKPAKVATIPSSPPAGSCMAHAYPMYCNHHTPSVPTNLVVRCDRDGCLKKSYLADWIDLSLTELPATIDGWDVDPETMRAYYLYSCPHCRTKKSGYSIKNSTTDTWSSGFVHPWIPEPPLIIPDDPLKPVKPILTRREWHLLHNFDARGKQLFSGNGGYSPPGEWK